MTSKNWQNAKTLLTKLVAKPRFGLLSDLDGTLSPISLTPEMARITPRNKEALAQFQAKLPLVALISGRRADNLQVGVGLPGLVYVGNHGLEQWIDGALKMMPEAQAFMPALRATKNDLRAISAPGVYIEDKEVILSLHYRNAANPIAFARNIAPQLAEIADKRKLELFTGKMVFEFRPPVHIDKGSAFQQLVSEYELQSALFLGDDVSDLNAFRMACKLREQQLCDAWGVGVQSDEAPDDLAETADFLADGVEDVEELLAWLLKARKASST